jgi:hypothetical protein
MKNPKRIVFMDWAEGVRAEYQASLEAEEAESEAGPTPPPADPGS